MPSLPVLPTRSCRCRGRVLPMCNAEDIHRLIQWLGWLVGLVEMHHTWKAKPDLR